MKKAFKNKYKFLAFAHLSTYFNCTCLTVQLGKKINIAISNYR